MLTHALLLRRLPRVCLISPHHVTSSTCHHPIHLFPQSTPPIRRPSFSYIYTLHTTPFFPPNFLLFITQKKSTITTMKSMLLRTSSIPVQQLNRFPSSGSPSPKFSPGHISSPSNNLSLKRSNSDSDMIRSARFGRTGSVSYPDMSVIVEEDEREFDFGGIGFGSGKGDRFNGGGKGGNNNNNNNNNKREDIGEYYQKMLKMNPGDPLLLRNYAKYLHEVEKNVEKAEEYYGRAILASPGDGELLSSYGTLIWETEKDEDRAQSYFNQAVHASPDDCMVLGSYAHFLWEADEDEDEEIPQGNTASPVMVGA